MTSKYLWFGGVVFLVAKLASPVLAIEVAKPASLTPHVASTQSQVPMNKAIQLVPPIPKMGGLQWDHFQLVYDEKNMTKDQPLPLVLYLSGHYMANAANILYKNRKVPLAGDRVFTIRQPVDQKVMHFQISGILSNGSIETDTFSVVIPDLQWNQALLWKHPPKSQKRYSFTVNAALTYLSYSEAYLTTRVTMMALTGKVGGQFAIIPRHLSISGNMYANLLPFVIQGTTELGGSLPEGRFFGGSTTLNWQLPFKSTDFGIFLSAGWYAWGMLVIPQVYGVSFMQGPQFLMSASARIAHRSASIYFKAAPIATEISQITMASRELAVGLKYSVTTVDAKRDWVITVDVAHLTTFNTAQNNSLELSNVSLGLQTNIGSK